jgi:clan AA aspartic protease
MIQGAVNAFREAVLPLQLRTPDGRLVNLDAVIDTGFSDYLALPPALVTSLHIPYYGTADYELGDGALVTFRVYTTSVFWDGQEIETPVLASDGGALIGMRMLYGYHLFVDVVDGGDVIVRPRS